MTLATDFLIAAVAWLAFLNGANDNFKCVAMLFGIGVASGTARWAMIGQILLAWLVTLPVAALLAFVICTAVA